MSSFACGAAVPTPLTPLIQMPSAFSLTIRAVARSGGPASAERAGRARAEPLRVDDRLGEVDVVLLEVLDVRRDVLGELGRLLLNARELAIHPDRQRGDHVDAPPVRPPGLPRDVLDPLAPEARDPPSCAGTR